MRIVLVLSFMLTVLFSLGARAQTPAFRTLQSFGAAGNGTTDDTAAVQSALNSGVPIACNGSFLISGLISVSSQNVFVLGTKKSCVFIYSTSQSMIYIDEPGQFGPLLKITISDLEISVRATIVSVSGPAHTAAIFINFDGGGSYNGPDPSVDISNLSIIPDVSGHYIENGLYLYQTNVTHLDGLIFLGDPGAFHGGVNAIVYDGTNSPSTLYLSRSQAGNVDVGLSLPNVQTAGFEGIRVNGFDCTGCNIIVNAVGSSDGLSDYMDLSKVEGAFYTVGIQVSNVSHVFIHENYFFAAPAPAGVAQPATVICINYSQQLALNPNGASENISGNTCDGYFVAGKSARLGVNFAGYNNSPMASVIGTNIFTNVDVGVVLQTGTAGVLVYPQVTRGVTSSVQNNSAPGNNSQVSSGAL